MIEVGSKVFCIRDIQEKFIITEFFSKIMVNENVGQHYWQLSLQYNANNLGILNIFELNVLRTVLCII